ncbi:MAG: CRTAC1 family protein [Halobacteriovoraceae bacterium]|nr:CRTAC1 family protein [Halobacteriovoraceae bacterium]
MDWILSIISLVTRRGNIFFLFFLLSCSSKLVVENVDQNSQKEETKNTQKINFEPGPTSKKDIFFEDVTEKMGLANITGHRFNIIDFNGDGYNDIVLISSHYSIPEFYEYWPLLKKFKKSNLSRLPTNERANSLLFFDYNNDNILDLLLITLNQKNVWEDLPLRLFKGILKGKQLFFEKSDVAFPKLDVPVASVAVVDYDLDGDLDLYLANWYNYKRQFPIPVPDKFLVNENGKFVDKPALLVGEPQKLEFENYLDITPSFGVSTCDFNNDGHADILVSSSSGHANKLWMNTTGDALERHFLNVASESKIDQDQNGIFDTRGGGNTFYMNCYDYNNDGIFDISVGEVSHSYESESRDRSSILTGIESSNVPKFLRSEYFDDKGKLNWTQSDKRSVWTDLNADSKGDLIVDNTSFPPDTRLVTFIQETSSSFEDKSEEFGINIVNPSGTVVFDFNGDGMLDILTGQTNIRDDSIKERIYLFENKLPKNFKQVFSIELTSPRIGAKIIFQTTKGKRTRWIQPHAGNFVSQSQMQEIFYLHDDEKLIHIEVAWPILKNGKKSQLVNKYVPKKNKKKIRNLKLFPSGKLVEIKK